MLLVNYDHNYGHNYMTITTLKNAIILKLAKRKFSKKKRLFYETSHGKQVKYLTK